MRSRPSLHLYRTGVLAAGLYSSTLTAQPDNRYVVTIDGRERDLTPPAVLQDCPQAQGEDDEIVICGRRREAARYRLPQRTWDPGGTVASVSRERHSLYEQGDSGIGSCSNVGPGGWTGCALRGWKAAREQYGR